MKVCSFYFGNVYIRNFIMDSLIVLSDNCYVWNWLYICMDILLKVVSRYIIFVERVIVNYM